MNTDPPQVDPCVDAMALAGDLVKGARQALRMHRVSSEGTDPFSVRVPSDAVEELVLNLSARVENCVEQIVPFAPHSPTANAFSGLIWQHVARRRAVHRFYLVPSSEDNQRRVQLQITEDRRHDLQSEPVEVTGDSAQAPMNTLWLIDDRVVVRQEPGPHGSGPWLVTGRPAEVARARTMIQALRDRVTRRAEDTEDEEPAGPDLTAWLLRSAQMLHHVAQMSCTENRLIGEDDCAWYHGAWQFLRFFNMVSSPTWHTEFYAQQIRTEIHERTARRILISGSADYTTLAFVLRAARPSNDASPVELDVHVVDLCRTPLLACRWYAERLGIKINIHQADITRKSDDGSEGFDPSEPFDLVVADAFLTRFDIAGAGMVLSRWFELLRDGGTVVTTVRLHPRNKYRGQNFDLDDDADHRLSDPVDDFELRLRERAAAWQDMLPIDLETLSHLGRTYAKRMISNDLGDADAVRKTFEDHQFALMEETAAPVRGELFGTEYLRVVARRPDRSSAEAVPD
ncbi:class I SAM-dependent methyltransferase [Paractinoplanes toevensis]|uniref:Uncharacterized protein n=1 Tax=Paractinoplanes toevensis TaxID=571911 RepID=A0A919WBZ4_9ACTN|nr:class I SAM-dependent methyltransferase [Actinoplanes toevensis]GIM97371.1 hypothetical protein Ato02nite_091640 [Actinoplanes toevensis]